MTGLVIAEGVISAWHHYVYFCLKFARKKKEKLAVTTNTMFREGVADAWVTFWTSTEKVDGKTVNGN